MSFGRGKRAWRGRERLALNRENFLLKIHFIPLPAFPPFFQDDSIESCKAGKRINAGLPSNSPSYRPLLVLTERAQTASRQPGYPDD
jgi:hypothetical protein